MKKKPMRIVDRSTGLMECKVCGARHYGQIRPDSGGKLYDENFDCMNGCIVDPAAKHEEASNP